MPYDFTSPTATEHQLEEPAARGTNRPAKVGHPVTVYSQETAEYVFDLITTGYNLRQIEAMRATEPELPARRTIHDWVKTRPDFARAYYIALEARASGRADEMITEDTIPAGCKPTWGIGTSSTRCGTQNCRPIGSGGGGKTKDQE
jgi:hypothetical protein